MKWQAPPPGFLRYVCHKSYRLTSCAYNTWQAVRNKDLQMANFLAVGLI